MKVEITVCSKCRAIKGERSPRFPMTDEIEAAIDLGHIIAKEDVCMACIAKQNRLAPVTQK